MELLEKKRSVKEKTEKKGLGWDRLTFGKERKKKTGAVVMRPGLPGDM